jgi:hypothetical protein
MDVPSKYAHLPLEALDKIEGWFFPEARALWLKLFAFQEAKHWLGAALELGVYQGCSLALLTATHPIAIGVDALLGAAGELLPPEHQASAIARIRDNVALLTPTEPTFIRSFTRDLDVDALRRHSPEGFSFIHVDGGHEADDVQTDLELADRLLAPTGVVAVDDVFNPLTAGVAEGLFSWFRTPRNLVAFVIAGNKTFFCRQTTHTPYSQEFSGPTMVRLLGSRVAFVNGDRWLEFLQTSPGVSSPCGGI